ncbi:MAG TPA: hypothetical protein VMF58_10755 [Rhizomicrobium sp.]|nr:hypothetical protein [Rhizomicrobium sp.]
MTVWKFNCMERDYPGLWQQWFKHQCVAVGWAPQEGYPLYGVVTGEHANGWKRTRATLERIEVGDFVVAALSGHRVGRIGQVTELNIQDADWKPLVPKSTRNAHGEIGRRVSVRWDFMTGPDNRELVVALPTNVRLSNGELRPTIAEIQSVPLDALMRAMSDPDNWVSLWSQFKYETELSDYIATFPHRLEDGLLPYPDAKIREKIFSDGKRSDVLVVECKQYSPKLKDIDQLRHYMAQLAKETEKARPRGILVHGGSRKLRTEIARHARKLPKVEIVQFRLDVDFSPCA